MLRTADRSPQRSYSGNLHCSPTTESHLHLTEARARQHRSRNGGDGRGAFRAIFEMVQMIVSVLEAGFLWRVRVLQGPATRHETITSVLSVVQVRSAILWLLRQRLLQCPSHKSRPLALVYLLSGAEDQQAGDHSGQHRKTNPPRIGSGVTRRWSQGSSPKLT